MLFFSLLIGSLEIITSPVNLSRPQAFHLDLNINNISLLVKSNHYFQCLAGLCRQSPAGQKKQKKFHPNSQITISLRNLVEKFLILPDQNASSLSLPAIIMINVKVRNSNSIQMTTSFVILTVEKNIADNHLSCTVIQRLARCCFTLVLGCALLFPQKLREGKKGKQRSFQ